MGKKEIFETIEKIKDTLDRAGWIKGEYGREGRGYCIIGAMIATMKVSSFSEAAADVRRELCRRVDKFVTDRKLPVDPDVVDFNDHPSITREDVDYILTNLNWE